MKSARMWLLKARIPVGGRSRVSLEQRLDSRTETGPACVSAQVPLFTSSACPVPTVTLGTLFNFTKHWLLNEHGDNYTHLRVLVL